MEIYKIAINPERKTIRYLLSVERRLSFEQANVKIPDSGPSQFDLLQDLFPDRYMWQAAFEFWPIWNGEECIADTCFQNQQQTCYWWLLRVTLVVDFGFLPQTFGKVAEV